jgi:hypothetical protein
MYKYVLEHFLQLKRTSLKDMFFNIGYEESDVEVTRNDSDIVLIIRTSDILKEVSSFISDQFLNRIEIDSDNLTITIISKI